MTAIDLIKDGVKPYEHFLKRGSFYPELSGKNIIDFIKCRDKEVLLEGTVGSGKTRAALEKILAIAYKYPGTRILILRKTRKRLSETTLAILEEQALPENHPLTRGAGRHNRSFYDGFGNGSRIVIAGCDDLDAWTAIMGSEWDIILIDEAIEMDKLEYETFLRGLRNNKAPYRQIICLTNPGPPSHWLNQRGNSGQMTRIKATLKDNPRFYSPITNEFTKEGTEYFSTLNKMSGVIKARLVDGLWRSADGIVYTEFNEDKHANKIVNYRDGKFYSLNCGKEEELGGVVHGCIDWGYNDPFVAGVWLYDSQNRLWLLKEFYTTECPLQTIMGIIDKFQSQYKITEWIADTSEKTIIKFIGSKGISISGAQKDIQGGIRLIKNRFANDSIFICANYKEQIDYKLAEKGKPTCIIDELGSYVWSARKPDEPEDKNQHHLDGLRYIVNRLDGIGEPSWHLSETPIYTGSNTYEDPDDIGWRKIGSIV